jgi:hypothetical protein
MGHSIPEMGIRQQNERGSRQVMPIALGLCGWLPVETPGWRPLTGKRMEASSDAAIEMMTIGVVYARFPWLRAGGTYHAAVT